MAFLKSKTKAFCTETSFKPTVCSLKLFRGLKNIQIKPDTLIETFHYMALNKILTDPKLLNTNQYIKQSFCKLSKL